MAEKKSKNNKAIVDTARERFRFAADAEKDIRQSAIEDIEFSVGDQWDDRDRKTRGDDGRPTLTVNRLPQFIRQITNDQRQNRPSIKVSPVDDLADPKTAKILQGIIRHIEYNSNADLAYDTAFDAAVRSSFGYMRVITDYEDPESFNQEILICPVRNQFSCYLDPNHTLPDGSDAGWGFAFEDIAKEEYEKLYPKSELSYGSDLFKSLGDEGMDWATEKTVRIAEYFVKEFEEKTIYQLSDGSVIEEDALELALAAGLTIDKKKTTSVPKVKWYKINGCEVLEEKEWPGKWIPIIPVYGNEVILNGKRILESAIRYAKDPQKLLNYWVSCETETIALAPRAPWIGYEGQFEGHEDKWRTANRRNHAYLEVQPVSINGQAAPLPQRNAFEPPVQAITNARLQASEDLKATTGIYDSALGARSNESSGVAIQRRADQAQTANFHFVDNLSRSMRHLGRILVDLIPKIYDTARAIHIIGEDDQKELIFVNKIFERNGKSEQYNLAIGKYDVTISNGPSYQTKRQEALESMLSLTQSYPQLMQIAGDLMTKNMDWPGADEISERIKRTIDPKITQSEKDLGQEIPPQVAQQMQQMNQMIEQLTQQVNQAHDIIDGKKLEIESKERIEFAKIEADLKKAFIKVDSQEAIELLKSEIDQINRRVESLGMPHEQDFESYEPQEGYSDANEPQGEYEQQPVEGGMPGPFMEQ